MDIRNPSIAHKAEIRKATEIGQYQLKNPTSLHDLETTFPRIITKTHVDRNVEDVTLPFIYLFFCG